MSDTHEDNSCMNVYLYMPFITVSIYRRRSLTTYNFKCSCFLPLFRLKMVFNYSLIFNKCHLQETQRNIYITQNHISMAKYICLSRHILIMFYKYVSLVTQTLSNSLNLGKFKQHNSYLPYNIMNTYLMYK